MMKNFLLIATLIFAPSSAFAEEVGGIHWTAPGGWKKAPEKPMRAASYEIAAVKPDAENAELAVFFFGPGQGGTVEANVDRWLNQFQQLDGKSSKSAAKIHTRTQNGLRVTTVEVAGTYTAMAGPMAPAASPREGYRLIGAIAEAPQGPVFFKLTGPARTVASAGPSFKKLIASVAATK